MDAWVETDDDDDGAARRYRAPALDKGLDVIELLARRDQPMTLSQISAALGRSVNELHRMIRVLERRGYIIEQTAGLGFILARKLFALASAQTPMQTLIEAALPRMRELAWRTGQACHLSVMADDEMTIISRIEAPGNLSFAVRVGRHRKLLGSNSGVVLYAFADAHVQAALNARMADYAAPGEIAAFHRLARDARERGYHEADSDFVLNVIDISAPVIGVDEVAALTVPFIALREPPVSFDAVIDAVREAARAIGEQIEGQQAG